jgi:WD40 repeat protein
VRALWCVLQLGSTLRVWDVSSQRHLATKKLHTLGLRCMVYSDVCEVLITVGFDFFAQAWAMNISHGTPVFRLIGHTKPLVSVALLSSKHQAVTADEGGFFKVNSDACPRLLILR